MIVDYHTHTALCKHGEGDIEEYILRAIGLGLDEIGCSEHMPMPGDFDLRHRMTKDEFAQVYAPRVVELAAKHASDITVRFGLEAEYVDGTEEWVRRFIGEYDFDYVIGSVHFIGRMEDDRPLFGKDYDRDDLEQMALDYYETVRRSASCGMFDIIAHCDLIKKFGRHPGRKVEEAVREALLAVKENDLCIEINTSGLRKPERETYPGEDILKMARELKIPLTLGSDAHRPHQVGAAFERAVELVERYGGGRICVFERRRRSEVPVSRLKVAYADAGTKGTEG